MIIDGKLIGKYGHDYLKDALNFPDYYGKNLDALYDILSTISCEIELINSEDVNEDIINTFEDAASVNNYLIFKIK